MLMLCPNCHSDDVITVQDQQICVNCGRLLTKAEAAAQIKKAPSSKIKVASKRGPGRPRAAKLDTPMQKPASHSVSINDIKPRRPAPQPASTPEITPIALKSKKAKIKHGAAFMAGFRALRPTWIALMLPGAITVAIALVYTANSYLHTARLQQAPEFTIAVLVFITGLVWLRFIRAGVMFQRAGVHDHRLSNYGSALRASLARDGQLKLFYLRHTAAALAELSLLTLVVWYGGRLTILPNLLHIGLLFIACFGLLYLLGSLWVVQRLVEAGIMVSSLKLPAAHWLAWRFWRKHWELLGARLIALLIILTLGAGVAIGLRAGLHGLDQTIKVCLLVGVGGFGIAILTVFSGGVTEDLYRQLVGIDESERSSRLLGQRHAVKPRWGAKVLFLAGLILPLAAAVMIAYLWH